MALTTCSVTTSVIANLGTNPAERGLTTDEFKAKFDEAATNLKGWINNTQTPELNVLENKANTNATNITALTTDAERDRGWYADLQRWHMQNVVQIATCEADEGWANNAWDGNVGGVVGDDTINYRVGNQAISIVGASGSGGHLVKALNLSIFSDGGVSTTSDYISFVVYIAAEELAKLGTDGIYISFQNNAYPSGTTYFYKNISKSSLTAGFNYIDIQKSAFITNGSPSWANVTGVTFSYGSISGSASISVDNVQMIRKDPTENKPNPFQHKENGTWVRDAILGTSEYTIVEENGQIVIAELSGNNTGYFGVESSFKGTKLYSDFELRSVQIAKQTGYNMRVGWEISTGNRLWVRVEGGLSIAQDENGNSTQLAEKPFTMAVGDILDFNLCKKGSSVTLTCIKNGTDTITLQGETTLSGEGYVILNPVTGVQNRVLSLSITTTSHASHASEADVAKRLNIKYKAGAFTADELDFGEIGIDTTNNRQYIKVNATTVKYSALT